MCFNPRRNGGNVQFIGDVDCDNLGVNFDP
jgi:hypothetical protein